MANMEDYRSLKSDGKRLASKASFDQAISKYDSAREVALDLDWEVGAVATNIDLANLYIAHNRFDDARTVLIRDIDRCKADEECSAEFLIFLYDAMVRLYLHHLRDIQNARSVVEEMIAERARFLSEDNFSGRFEGYSEAMRKFGFTEDADALSKRIKALD